jgi:hypothetical protein
VSVHNVKSPSSVEEGQFLYCGRWVDKKHFRAYVYSRDGKKIANSYQEYIELTATGLWFDEPPKKEVNQDARTKPKRQSIRRGRIPTD